MIAKKKRFLIPVLLLFVSVKLFADLSHVGSSNRNIDNHVPVVQTIYGFIGETFSLEISEPRYGGTGINLDVTDTSNVLRYQIAPTNAPLTQAGAIIGSFSITTSNINKIITITHTPLVLVSDSSVTIDWEMGIGWTIGGVHQFRNCLSIDDNLGEANRKIEINLSGTGASAVRIQDAQIYFRLTSSSAVSEAGQYHASVIFDVESTT